MLPRFVEAGMICLTAEEGRRKSYRITEKGRQMLQEEYIRLTVLVEDARDYFTEVSAH